MPYPQKTTAAAEQREFRSGKNCDRAEFAAQQTPSDDPQVESLLPTPKLPFNPTGSEFSQSEQKQRQISPRRILFKGFAILACTGIGGILALRGLNFLASAVSCAGPYLEARSNVGAINRAQQAYFENNQRFANSLQELQIGLKSETQNYRYSVQATENAVFHYGIYRHQKTQWQKFMGEQESSSYVGAVFVVPGERGSAKTTMRVLCESETPGSIQPVAPTLQNGKPICPPNFRNRLT